MDKGVSSISSYKKKNDVNAYTYVYTVILTLLPFLDPIQLNFRNHFVIRQQIITL